MQWRDIMNANFSCGSTSAPLWVWLVEGWLLCLVSGHRNISSSGSRNCISNPVAQEFMLQLQKDSARSGLVVKDDDWRSNAPWRLKLIQRIILCYQNFNIQNELPLTRWELKQKDNTWTVTGAFPQQVFKLENLNTSRYQELKMSRSSL